MEDKFTEFALLLEKSNTEALVKAIENVIGGFNERLNELLERLVKENFDELNKSVQNLNTWQIENKEMIEKLTSQFTEVSENLSITSDTIDKISKSTTELIQSDGILSKLIKELQDVMVDNTLFKDSVQTLFDSTGKLDDSSKTLNEWIIKEKNLSESISNLIENLKEIEQLRKETGGFFNDIKQKMIEGVNVIKQGNANLLENVNRLEESFTERMNQSFRSLDKILQAMVLEYSERMK